MKKILLVLLPLIYSTNQLIAQVNFTEGFILKTPSDTLFGLIDDRNYLDNSLYCDFRESMSSEVKRFYPGELYGYRISSGKFYVSKPVNINGNNVLFFMEYLINGELDVFFRQDDTNTNLYYASKDSTPLYELRYKKELVRTNDRVYEKVNKEFIGTLKVLTRDYPQFSKQIEKTAKPGHSSMIMLAENYHNYVCRDKECIIYDKPNPFRFSVEIVSGYVAGRNLRWYRRLDHIVYGFSFLVNNAEYNEDVYIGIGYMYEGMYADKDLDNAGPDLEALYKYRQHRIPLLMGYYPNRKALSPIFQTAVSFDVFSKHKDIQMSLSLAPGLKYEFENIYIKTYTELEILLDPLIYFSSRLGFSLGFKL
jgi:hypothetical protein